MNKPLLTLAACLISAHSFAGCLSTAEAIVRQENAGSRRFSLVTRTGTVLAPGADSITGYGELFNPTRSTAEVFVIAEATQFGTNYKGLLLEQGTCKYLGVIALNDDFDR